MPKQTTAARSSSTMTTRMKTARSACQLNCPKGSEGTYLSRPRIEAASPQCHPRLADAPTGQHRDFIGSSRVMGNGFRGCRAAPDNHGGVSYYHLPGHEADFQ